MLKREQQIVASTFVRVLFVSAALWSKATMDAGLVIENRQDLSTLFETRVILVRALTIQVFGQVREVNVFNQHFQVYGVTRIRAAHHSSQTIRSAENVHQGLPEDTQLVSLLERLGGTE